MLISFTPIIKPLYANVSFIYPRPENVRKGIYRWNIYMKFVKVINASLVFQSFINKPIIKNYEFVTLAVLYREVLGEHSNR